MNKEIPAISFTFWHFFSVGHLERKFTLHINIWLDKKKFEGNTEQEIGSTAAMYFHSIWVNGELMGEN